MRGARQRFVLGTVVILALFGCSPGVPSSATPETTAVSSPVGSSSSTATSSPTSLPPASTTTSRPPGETIVVTSPADNGPNTLRQALLDAKTGDMIVFDPVVFPPDNPVSIMLEWQLPGIFQGYLTIDASTAGVIIDGSGDPNVGSPLYIVSDENAIIGLQMRNFSGAALHISGGHNNLIKDNVIGGGDYGIGLWGGASHNRITGNHIGVLADGMTPLAIRGIGITLSEGAHSNQIGPNNTIAFSGEDGIGFGLEGGMVGNTISENSIHSNGQKGIALYGNNDSLAAPALFDFDLQAGTLAGAACAGCVVEVFSDTGGEGAGYAGQAVADEEGRFTFDNGTAFKGPFLTATATDSAGNTSEFSPHTFGSTRSLTIQEGNSESRATIVLQPYQGLADNRMSTFNVLDPQNAIGSLREVEQLGTRWMRGSLDHMEWELAVRDDWYSQSEITAMQDRAISVLADNGTTIIYVLMHFDRNLHAERAPDYGNEEDVQLFLDYTRMIVTHFRGRIPYYEILNEPMAYVEVEDYINLIRRMIPVIREADPQAKIVVGGATALRHEYSRDYLFDVLQSDVIGLVDVIGFHPLYGESPSWYETSGYYYNYPSLVQEIKDVATAHGFNGEYVAGEMVWRTPAFPNLAEQPSDYTDTVAAKYTARAVVLNLGMGVVAGTTEANLLPIVSNTVRNLSNVMAGASALPLANPLQSEHLDIVSYSFSLPNGETLIALWTNDAAVDQDPGIASTVVLPGFSGYTATGVDVLYGYTQELITNDDGGDLVIEDLLVADYPVILRLAR